MMDCPADCLRVGSSLCFLAGVGFKGISLKALFLLVLVSLKHHWVAMETHI